MKCRYLFVRIGEGLVIADDIVSDGQTLWTASLRGQHTLGLRFAFRIADEKSVDLGLLIAVHDKNSIDI